MKLFENEKLSTHTDKYTLSNEKIQDYKSIFSKWNKKRELKENSRLSQDFIKDVFDNILGYNSNDRLTEFTLIDKTRAADCVIGFILDL